MARPKLNMTPEERKIHEATLHKKQTRLRRERAEREAYRAWVRLIFETVEKLGWDKTELLLGPDNEIMDAVVEELMQDDRFKITLGAKVGLKIKEDK